MREVLEPPTGLVPQCRSHGPTRPPALAAMNLMEGNGSEYCFESTVSEKRTH